jgi:hypothetical protein
MGPRVRFRHVPNVTTVIAGSLILPRSPWDTHSSILCSAQSALIALCRRRVGGSPRAYRAWPWPSGPPGRQWLRAQGWVPKMLSAERLESIFGCPCGWRGRHGQCAAFRSGELTFSPGDRRTWCCLAALTSSRRTSPQVHRGQALMMHAGGTRPFDTCSDLRESLSLKSGRSTVRSCP